MRRRHTITAVAALAAGIGAFALYPHVHDLLRQATSAAALPVSGPATAGPSTSTSAGSAFVQEPDEGMSRIYQVITGAKHSVAVTMYELQDDTAVQDLIAAQQRGVQVRVLLDQAFHGRQANTAAYAALEGAGVPVRWEPASVIVHQKTITADSGTPDEVSAVGTGNLQTRYYPSTWDAWLLNTAPAQVAAISATFDNDWNVAPGGSVRRSRRMGCCGPRTRKISSSPTSIKRRRAFRSPARSSATNRSSPRSRDVHVPGWPVRC